MYKESEILYNKESELHTDSKYPLGSYVILTTFGDFKGTHLRILHLGLRLRLESGDAVDIRGRVLPHEIKV